MGRMPNPTRRTVNHLQATPYTWGPKIETDLRNALFKLNLEKPAPSIRFPVSLLK
jgi:hypothetical protein